MESRDLSELQLIFTLQKCGSLEKMTGLKVDSVALHITEVALKILPSPGSHKTV